MTFTERIEKLLGANYLKEVIDEFLKFLNEVPQSNRDARNDANQLRGQIIVLSGRFTDLNSRVNSNIIDSNGASQEKAVLINSFIQILNQLPSNYPDLNNYMQEKNEEDEWRDAQKKNTIEAYQIYFSKYPNGKYKADTIKLIAELEEVKLKQDNEIKRLAALEKERREKDKVAEESQKPHTASTTHTSYQTINPVHQGHVATLPRPKSRTGLYIALGVLIGIIFIIILALAFSSDTDNNVAGNSPQSTENTGATAEPGNAVKAEVRLAFESAIQTFTDAAFYLDPAQLSKFFTGEGLRTTKLRIDELFANDTYVESMIDNRDYKNIQVSSDELSAEVQVVETWHYIYYHASTKLCYGKIPPKQSSLTVYMKKTEAGWMVNSFVLGNEALPALEPCD